MIWLSDKDVARSVKQGYLTATINWYGGFAGLLLLLCLWLICAVFIWHNTSTQSLVTAWLSFVSIGALSIYAVYSLATERRLTMIVTHLSANENRLLLLGVFKKLEWGILQNKQHVVSSDVAKRWFEVDAFAIALIADNQIYLNMASDSDTKGRVPFSFKNNRRLHLLINTINQAL
ncbi:hypothetical protein [Hymenobacter elongatus]|uniref:Uncharacterized protein n=1 Tax=Hymenobacter elongatus TaxID=877208 RepID=A0A4Z0PPR7_9BACT|nr:hypothetical protein [Hymenobacter elongatus]TGE18664.1 hypothetical protein E5J99_04990 [Hymenobacter elongatus]